MNFEVIQALKQLEKERGIPKEAVIEALEAALISAFKKNYGTSQNVKVQIHPETGQISVFAYKTVVEQPSDPRLEISLDEAEKVNPEYQVGDVFEVEITPGEFGRIAAQTAKQVVVQKIREAERGIIYEEFSNREGEVVTGIVQRRDERNVIVDLGRVEAIMPLSEQVQGEHYSYGDRLKVYILEARKTPRGPQVIVSRSHPALLKRLLELEVPEIHEGIVEIKDIAREAGHRSKVSVLSYDPNVDAVGACVGPRGMRIQRIVAELKGEKVDIIQWHNDPGIYVSNALSPARVILTRVDEENHIARAIVPDSQLSLAIGKEGQNARLAAKLTGWKVDIKSDSQVRALEEEEERLMELEAEAAADSQEELIDELAEELEEESVHVTVEDEDAGEGVEVEGRPDEEVDITDEPSEDMTEDSIEEAVAETFEEAVEEVADGVQAEDSEEVFTEDSEEVYTASGEEGTDVLHRESKGKKKKKKGTVDEEDDEEEAVRRRGPKRRKKELYEEDDYWDEETDL
jgi:N utilization substance protein A